MNQVIENVSDTAFLVAGFRGMETDRPDPLFRDPLAWKLAGEHGRRKILATVPRRFLGAWSVVIRTVIIDSFIQDAIAGGVDTVLNLGAGLDTRPYRMDLPKDLRWIEVDYPNVIDLKDERLAGEQPNCRLERVKLDLTDRAARQKFFAEVNARARAILVLTEGVTPYLSEDDVSALAEDLRKLDKLRGWIVDYFSPQALNYGRKLRARFMQAAPFLFEPKDWFGFFEEHGWHAQDVRYLGDEAERLHRPMPLRPLMKAWIKLVGVFMSREQRQALTRQVAYVLLVPK
jgi:methyltransferase (TIGR00027 family)